MWVRSAIFAWYSSIAIQYTPFLDMPVGAIMRHDLHYFTTKTVRFDLAFDLAFDSI